MITRLSLRVIKQIVKWILNQVLFAYLAMSDGIRLKYSNQNEDKIKNNF